MLQSRINANSFGGTFAFLPTLKAKLKNAKEPPSQRTTTDQMNGQTIYRQEGRTANMGLASCGVKCLNSSSVFQINFSAGLTVLCPEIPHERQAQKRKL